MSNKTNSAAPGIIGLLGIAFVILKLCKVITWSWWWVTAPFWGFIALAVILFAVVAIFKIKVKS